MAPVTNMRYDNIVGQSREPNDPPIAALCVADLLLMMSHKARRRPNQQSYDDSEGMSHCQMLGKVEYGLPAKI